MVGTAGDIAIDPNEINDSDAVLGFDISTYTQSVHLSVL